MSDFFDNADLDEQAAKDQEEFDSPDWTPEEGEAIDCVLLSHKAVKTKYGMKLVLIVRNVGDAASGSIEAGKSGNLWCPAVLQRKVLELTPAQGSAMKVRFEGKVQPEKGGNAYNNHIVMVERAAPQAWMGVAAQLDGGGTASAPAQAQQGSDWKF